MFNRSDEDAGLILRMLYVVDVRSTRVDVDISRSERLTHLSLFGIRYLFLALQVASNSTDRLYAESAGNYSRRATATPVFNLTEVWNHGSSFRHFPYDEKFAELCVESQRTRRVPSQRQSFFSSDGSYSTAVP